MGPTTKTKQLSTKIKGMTIICGTPQTTSRIEDQLHRLKRSTHQSIAAKMTKEMDTLSESTEAIEVPLVANRDPNHLIRRKTRKNTRRRNPRVQKITLLLRNGI